MISHPCPSFFVLHLFLSTLGTCLIFINSVATPTLRPPSQYRKDDRVRWMQVGWMQEDGKEGGTITEASLVFGVMEELCYE